MIQPFLSSPSAGHLHFSQVDTTKVEWMMVAHLTIWGRGRLKLQKQYEGTCRRHYHWSTVSQLTHVKWKIAQQSANEKIPQTHVLQVEINLQKDWAHVTHLIPYIILPHNIAYAVRFTCCNCVFFHSPFKVVPLSLTRWNGLDIHPGWQTAALVFQFTLRICCLYSSFNIILHLNNVRTSLLMHTFDSCQS